MDLASNDSIRSFAKKLLEQEPHLDILVNNAGVIVPKFKTTADGYEYSFAVNYLGHFLLTNLLLERMRLSPSARIVNVTSIVYRLGKIDFSTLNSPASFDCVARYFESKLALVMFTRALAERLKDTAVVATAVHPGFVRTVFSNQLDPLRVSFTYTLVLSALG